jgi:hypothetical protein
VLDRSSPSAPAWSAPSARNADENSSVIEPLPAPEQRDHPDRRQQHGARRRRGLLEARRPPRVHRAPSSPDPAPRVPRGPVLRHQAGEGSPDRRRVAFHRDALQLGHLGAQRGFVLGGQVPGQDALAPRHARLLVLRVQLLVQLLAGPQPDERDVDVLALGEAREPDHLARHVHHLHGLAHVEQEHLAALADRRGLEHQSHRLGDGHEVTRGLGVGHRERAAALELALEQRHDRALAAEHVAEAHRAVASLAAPRSRLHEPFAHALGRAHHARRPHRLVGRHQHEVLDPVPAGRVDQQPRAHHVVEHGLARRVLEQRHVLVRGRVQHHLWPVRGEHRLEPARIAQVGDAGGEHEHARRGGEFALDEIEPVLGVVHEHQLGRVEARHLPRQLRADRAARAGDQHPPPPEKAPMSPSASAGQNVPTSPS